MLNFYNYDIKEQCFIMPVQYKMTIVIKTNEFHFESGLLFVLFLPLTKTISPTPHAHTYTNLEARKALYDTQGFQFTG